jgi:hypothetical protein
MILVRYQQKVQTDESEDERVLIPENKYTIPLLLSGMMD